VGDVAMSWLGDPAPDISPAVALEVAGLFQLGRILRLAGQREAARVLLQRAVDLRPRFEIYRALGDPSFDPAAIPAVTGRRLSLDISDLLHFFISHGLVTGIQRVQLEILSTILSDTLTDGAPGNGPDFSEVVFCFSELSRVWRLRERDLRALVAYARAGRVDTAKARRIVRRAKARAPPYTPPAGSSYLVLGAFWSGDRQAHMRVRAGGAALGVFVHDLFPIRAPALCEPGATAAFESSFRAGLASWDFIVANSAFTAGDVRDYMAENGHAESIPIMAAPLAHSHAAPRHRDGSDGAASRRRRFVLCVGTLEPRKNLKALVETWEALGEAHPDLPDLILVGRRGWRMEEMVAQLESGKLKRRKIKWLEAISDARLDRLYKECLFTVFPSFAEGWGLPIGEALVHGKVCIASNTTAMPEVGGEFAIYTDPYDRSALQSAIETLIYDKGALAEREAWIRRDFHPRTWRDVTRGLIGGILALQKA
jgi:glycosyltransferase involved in cell wall biosynthesis